jgi:cell division protein FtsB
MTKKLISEIDKLKRDLAFKREELQAMYLENKGLNKTIDSLEKENHSLKQQIKQLEQEAEEMLLYP